MTIASPTRTTYRQPAGIDRLAQRLGLALVAWSERSTSRPELSEADLRLTWQQARAADQLLADRDAARAQRQARLF